MDSLVRLIQVGSWAGGLLALAVALITKIAGVHLAGASPHGIVFFAGACFICSVASRELAAAERKAEETKEGPKAKAAAA